MASSRVAKKKMLFVGGKWTVPNIALLYDKYVQEDGKINPHFQDNLVRELKFFATMEDKMDFEWYYQKTLNNVHAVESFLAGVESNQDNSASAYISKMRCYCYDIRTIYLPKLKGGASQKNVNEPGNKKQQLQDSISLLKRIKGNLRTLQHESQVEFDKDMDTVLAKLESIKD